MNVLSKIGLAAMTSAVLLGPPAGAQCPPVQTLVPGGMPQGAGYGNAVSMDGDVAIIGARFDTTFSSREGSAYVWRHDGEQWNLETKLQASDGVNGDQFGQDVAVSGNVIAVSALLDDDMGSNSGSVYVYRFDGTAWNLETKLTRASGGANDNWGEQVALDGNVLAVTSLSRSLVDVYRYQGGFLGWQLEATFTSDVFFGESVAVDGNTMVLGDSSQIIGGFSSGAAYVYDHDGSQWNLTQTLSPANPNGSEAFGAAVSIRGARIAVGAIMPNATGAVFLFEQVGGTWTQTDELVPAGFPSGQRFGDSVALGDDCLIAGDAFFGKPYEFRKVRGVWVESQFYVPTGGTQRLGLQVAVDGDQAILTSGSESAFEFAAAGLRMTVSPGVVNAGDVVTLDTFCGPPNNLAGMFVVGANGSPLFETLLMFRFGGNCHLTASAPVPSGLAGLQLDLMSIGVGPGGRAIASNIEPLIFQ